MKGSNFKHEQVKYRILCVWTIPETTKINLFDDRSQWQWGYFCMAYHEHYVPELLEAMDSDFSLQKDMAHP